jgi:hypothetical protein
MTGKKAGIVLIVSKDNRSKYLSRVIRVIEKNKLKIDTWFIEIK